MERDAGLKYTGSEQKTAWRDQTRKMERDERSGWGYVIYEQTLTASDFDKNNASYNATPIVL